MLPQDQPPGPPGGGGGGGPPGAGDAAAGGGPPGGSDGGAPGDADGVGGGGGAGGGGAGVGVAGAGGGGAGVGVGVAGVGVAGGAPSAAVMGDGVMGGAGGAGDGVMGGAGGGAGGLPSAAVTSFKGAPARKVPEATWGGDDDYDPNAKSIVTDDMALRKLLLKHGRARAKDRIAELKRADANGMFRIRISRLPGQLFASAEGILCAPPLPLHATLQFECDGDSDGGGEVSATDARVSVWDDKGRSWSSDHDIISNFIWFSVSRQGLQALPPSTVYAPHADRSSLKTVLPRDAMHIQTHAMVYHDAPKQTWTLARDGGSAVLGESGLNVLFRTKAFGLDELLSLRHFKHAERLNYFIQPPVGFPSDLVRHLIPVLSAMSDSRAKSGQCSQLYTVGPSTAQRDDVLRVLENLLASGYVICISRDGPHSHWTFSPTGESSLIACESFSMLRPLHVLNVRSDVTLNILLSFMIITFRFGKRIIPMMNYMRVIERERVEERERAREKLIQARGVPGNSF